MEIANEVIPLILAFGGGCAGMVGLTIHLFHPLTLVGVLLVITGMMFFKPKAVEGD